MIDRFDAETVTVRATKPEPPIPLPWRRSPWRCGRNVARRWRVLSWLPGGIAPRQIDLSAKAAPGDVGRAQIDRQGEAADGGPPRRCAGAHGPDSIAVIGYLGLGSNVGDRMREPARGARRARARGGRCRRARRRSYETAPQGQVLDQPEFLNAAVRMRERARSARSCSRPARRSSASSAASPAACATGRARSTWTCCCSATSSAAPIGSRCRTARSRAGASSWSRCSSSTPSSRYPTARGSPARLDAVRDRRCSRAGSL